VKETENNIPNTYFMTNDGIHVGYTIPDMFNTTLRSDRDQSPVYMSYPDFWPPNLVQKNVTYTRVNTVGHILIFRLILDLQIFFIL
jgi:hypothetical protein